MMAQDRVKSTRENINYGRLINQFPPDIIKSTRLSEQINKKYVDKNVFNVQSNLRGAFNRFADFFVQAIEIVIDS